jgi:hypothetical protein
MDGIVGVALTVDLREMKMLNVLLRVRTHQVRRSLHRARPTLTGETPQHRRHRILRNERRGYA